MEGGDDLRDSKMLSHALFNAPNLYVNGVEHRKTHMQMRRCAFFKTFIFQVLEIEKN